MIDPTAIRTYLNKPTRDYDWAKALTDQEIADALAEYRTPLVFTLPPFHHQYVCVLIGMVLRSFAFLTDMGSGKSKIVLDIIVNRMRQDPSIRRSIIFAPYLLHLESWREQIEKHAPSLSYKILDGSSKARIRDIEKGSEQLYVLNYGGLVALCTSRPPKGVKKTRFTKRQQIKDEVVEILARVFQLVVFDESTAFKNHQSLTYLVAAELARMIPYRYCLTGTPFGKDPHDLWSQFYVLDFGETLGPTISFFREAFFKTKQNYWGHWEHTFDKKKTGILGAKLKNRSICYAIEECIDLPPKIYNKTVVHWGTDGREYYEKIRQALKTAAKESGMDSDGHFMQARQATSGFIQHKLGSGEKRLIEFTTNPKLDALVQMIELAPPTAKLVVFHFFIPTSTLISRRLTKEKIKHVCIWSGTKDKAGTLNTFLQKPDYRVLVINEGIGAMGLNLQLANYVIFFEPPIDPITREQAERRIYRPGQTNTCFYYDLIMQGTVDEKIYASTKAGKNLWSEVLGKRASLQDLI